MSEPFVYCICPSARPEYRKRAIACYEAQTYPENKRALVLWDTSTVKATVGALRNRTIAMTAKGEGDCIAHFDDDDWSAPIRLAEQVAFMEATGAPIVGYYDLPFYDEIRDKVTLYDSHNPHYAVGTSLMYRREVWEAHPFPDQNDEDTTWQATVGASNVRACSCIVDGAPRMFATIHRRNTSAKAGARYSPAAKELERAVRNLLTGDAQLVHN